MDQIRVDYHYVDGRITQVSHVYEKDGSVSLLNVRFFNQIIIYI
jgi:hypothetical protein